MATESSAEVNYETLSWPSIDSALTVKKKINQKDSIVVSMTKYQMKEKKFEPYKTIGLDNMVLKASHVTLGRAAVGGDWCYVGVSRD